MIPDGRLVYRTPRWEIEAFVEIDLGTERLSRFIQKIVEYLAAWRAGIWRGRLAAWPLVLTATTTDAHAHALWRATDELLRGQRDAERIFSVTEFSFAALQDLLGPEGPLGEVWQVAGKAGRHRLIPTPDETSVAG